MPRLARLAPALAVAALVLSAPSAAQSPRTRLDGAWTMIRRVSLMPDTTVDYRPTTSVMLFAGHYYSMMFALPETPGVQQASVPSTAEEKARRFDAFVAQSGRFELRDTTLVTRPMIAKVPANVGRTIVQRYRLRGDTLWLVAHTPWQRDSTKMVQTTMTLVRQR